MEVTVGPVAHGGDCVSRPADGPVLFVRHALPGERVVVRVTEDLPFDDIADSPFVSNVRRLAAEANVLRTLDDARQSAQSAMRSGKSELHHFSLTADEASEEGMVCGGTMDIFVEVFG